MHEPFIDLQWSNKQFLSVLSIATHSSRQGRYGVYHLPSSRVLQHYLDPIPLVRAEAPFTSQCVLPYRCFHVIVAMPKFSLNDLTALQNDVKSS